MTRKAPRRFPILIRIGQFLSVLIVILWGCSMGWQIRYVGDSHAFRIARNGVVKYYWWDKSIDRPFKPSVRGFSYISLTKTWRRFEFTLPETGAVSRISYVHIPLWMPLLAVATPTAILWYRHRNRPMPGCCTKCRYDLTGNESGICPECGTKVERP